MKKSVILVAALLAMAMQPFGKALAVGLAPASVSPETAAVPDDGNPNAPAEGVWPNHMVYFCDKNGSRYSLDPSPDMFGVASLCSPGGNMQWFNSGPTSVYNKQLGKDCWMLKKSSPYSNSAIVYYFSKDWTQISFGVTGVTNGCAVVDVRAISKTQYDALRDQSNRNYIAMQVFAHEAGVETDAERNLRYQKEDAESDAQYRRERGSSLLQTYRSKESDLKNMFNGYGGVTTTYRDGSKKIEYNHRNNAANLSATRRMFLRTQQEMRTIREKARAMGTIIPQSPYETAKIAPY